MKNQKESFIESLVLTLITGVLTSIIASIIFYLIDINVEKFNISVTILTLVIIITLSLLLITTLINHIRKTVQATQNSIKADTESNLKATTEAREKIELIIKANADGFRKTTLAETITVANKFIANASRVRVIGMGRQFKLATKANSQDVKLLQQYYQATEDRLKRPCSTIHGRFIYQRITTRDITTNFSNHLKTCFEAGKQNNHRVEVSFLDNYELAYTYIIFDDKKLILQIQNLNEDGKIDTELNFCCNNKEVIQKYSKHFDRLWKKRYYVSSFRKFEQELVLINPLVQQIKEIRRKINSISYNSIALYHAQLEIAQTHSRLEGLAKGILPINHKIANGKLLSIFSFYIKSLQKGDEYKTISFYKFWKNIDETEDIDFVNANIQALQNGAKLHRIFAIKESCIKDIISHNHPSNNQYFKKIRNKIALQKSIVTRDINKNYNVQFVFLTDLEYQDYQKRYYNFGIVKKKNQQILFVPNDHSKNGTESTKLCFIDTPEIRTKTNKNQQVENTKLLHKYELHFEGVQGKQQEQLQKLLVDKKSDRYLFLQKFGFLPEQKQS